MQAQLNELTKEELIDRVVSLEKENARIIELEYQLAELKRLIFGTKSERFVPAVEPNQLSFDFGTEEKAETPQVSTETIAYERKKKQRKEKPVRQQIPAHLRRVDIIIKPEEDITGAVEMGKEITEVMEIIPPELYVNRFIRIKYAFPKQEEKGVLIGKLPAQPIHKGVAGASLLAYILIGKYGDHLPIYRQVQRFKREGVQIADSTIYDWIAQSCELLEPLYDLLRQKVVRSSYLQVDETPIPVLDKDKKGSTHRGYHWAYHAVLEKLVLFDYRPGRGREGPESLLKSFRGILQTDGYAAYEAFDKREGISLLGCLAHIRRYFEKALETNRTEAEEVMKLIQKLYEVERMAKEQNLSFTQRLELRKKESIPVWTDLGNWLKEKYQTLLPQSPIGKAAYYFLGRFNYMSRYLSDGRLEIDNNLAENAIRPIALGRKNYLFAGSHEGAQRAALIYSFLATCKKNNIDPSAWLQFTLKALPTTKPDQLEDLLPCNWKPTEV